MSLISEDRVLLTQLHLDKARACLKEGEQLLQMESISAAANRFYYAVFHTIHALFVTNGIQARTHNGTIAHQSKFYQDRIN